MVNLPHVGDVSFTPSVRATPTPGRSAEARGVSGSGASAPGQSATPSAPFRGSDSVELSSAARSAGERPIRSDLVDRVRRQIAEGTYDEDAKLDVVAEKLAKLFDIQG